MFILGHTGIGSRIVKRWSQKLNVLFLLLGMLLPDMIDKPLYYGLSFYYGKKGADLGLISGSRTFGHTGLFLIFLLLITYYLSNKKIAAITLGLASHLFLDQLGDMTKPLSYITWPLTSFPTMPFENIKEHALSFFNPYVFFGEVLGGIFLYLDYFKKFKIRSI